jgi:hypothetical protein
MKESIAASLDVYGNMKLEFFSAQIVKFGGFKKFSVLVLDFIVIGIN